MIIHLTTRVSILLALVCALIGAGWFGTSAHAQTAPTTPTTQPALLSGVILKQDTDDAHLGNNFYVVPDPDKSLSLRLVTEKFLNRTLGNMIAQSPLINLGLKSQTTWVVIPVTNVSTSELWELDFGNSISGRETFLSRISVYNSFTRTAVFNSTPPDRPPYSIGRKIHLNIPIGQSGFLIIEARNPAGTLSMLDLSLKRSYQADTSTSWIEALLARIPLLAAIILLSGFVLRRDLSLGAFGLAWALIYLHIYLVDHYIFNSTVSAQLFTPMVWVLVALLLIIGFGLSEQGRADSRPLCFSGRASCRLSVACSVC